MLVQNSIIDQRHCALQESGDEVLPSELMPDGLHPSAKGMELMTECLKPHLRRAGIYPA